MCGRYSLIADIAELGERFEFDGADLTQAPRYNIAPTQMALTVTSGDGRHASYMRWGLIPSLAKSDSVGSRMINARAETVAERPSFRNSLQHRRCLVLADGFYEWQRTGKVRRPMRIVMKSGEPFAFAGLWDTWKDPKGEIVRSCTIITTRANDPLNPIHNRMPVILPREMEGFWLEAGVREAGALSDVLAPYRGEDLDVYEVSPLMNRATYKGAEAIAHVN